MQMESEGSGLARSVRKGDDIILSTGATARALRDYPAGYDGTLELELDGKRMADETRSVTLPAFAPGAEQTLYGAGDSGIEVDTHAAREPDRRMRD